VLKVWGDKKSRVHLRNTKQKLQLTVKLQPYALYQVWGDEENDA
jgi:hypothetical protein